MKPVIVFLLLTGAVASYGKDKNPKKQDDSPQDQITVLAHIPSAGGPVTRFIATQHYGHAYVYAEHESGKSLTLIDLTNPSRPAVLADVAFPDSSASPSLLTAAGTAALVSDTPAADARTVSPQVIRIMNLSDPLHPTVSQEFKGVTATSRDAQPGLILLANADGIWILQQHFALDPAVEKSYAYKVLYGDSMYH